MTMDKGKRKFSEYDAERNHTSQEEAMSSNPCYISDPTVQDFLCMLDLFFLTAHVCLL